MAFTAAQIISLRAPQYATDTRITDLITLAREQTGTEFGDQYELAVALRVMHWKAREEMRGGTATGTSSGTGEAGMVTSESEGQLSRSFGRTGTNQRYGDLATTVYGVELIDLMGSCLFLPRTRMM
jgi:hypothetical protein